MTMSEKEIRKWYQDHGIEYVAEDWGPRNEETGESAGPNNWWGNNPSDMRYRIGMTPGILDWLDQEGKVQHIYSGPRTPEEQAFIESLEDFFRPYVALLPRPKGNLITEYMGMRRTQADIARETGVTQQAVSAALRSALRALIRRIAEDDPTWTPPADGRVRDYEGELSAAEKVYDKWRATKV